MLSTINVITFLNLLALFVIFFFRKNNTLPNKILALILINPGINFISNVVVLSGHFVDFPYLFFFSQITAYAFAPLTHMYSDLMIGQRINRKQPMYYLSLLAMALIVFFAGEYLLMPQDQQAQYLTGLQQEPYPWQQSLINGMFILFQQIYFSLAAINIYRYKKRLTQTLSNLEKTKIAYISRFIVFIWLLNLITIVLYLSLPMTIVEYVCLPAAVTVIYFFILYYAYRYHSVFTVGSYHQFLEDNTPATIEEVAQFASQNTLEGGEAVGLAQKIAVYLDKEQPFLNPDLNLEMLSRMMSVPCGKISGAISKGMNKNFYDLINEKRIETAKQLLKEKHQELTIESIAYESGFNSRASFYRAFKKYTRLTPKEFLAKP